MTTTIDGERDEVSILNLAALSGVPYALRAAVVLGVPDILNGAESDTKLTAQEIASRIATPNGVPADGENLDRLLRLLASYQVVSEELTTDSNERRYGTTPVLRCLSEDNDGVSLDSHILMYTDHLSQKPMQYVHEPILDRKALPFTLAFGKEIFDYMATDPRLRAMFNKSHAHFTHMCCRSLLREYKGFAAVKSLVDVGGGIGANLALVLSENPHLRGINFDLPHVVADGIQAPRLEQVGGDFFQEVPSAEAIFMKWILHDWPDKECIQILKNCHKALPAHGKIINIDLLVPEVTDSSMKTNSTVCMDLIMMLFTSGGKERTLSEFRQIAAEAGFPRVEIAAQVNNQVVLELYKF